MAKRRRVKKHKPYLAGFPDPITFRFGMPISDEIARDSGDLSGIFMRIERLLVDIRDELRPARRRKKSA